MLVNIIFTTLMFKPLRLKLWDSWNRNGNTWSQNRINLSSLLKDTTIVKDIGLTTEFIDT